MGVIVQPQLKQEPGHRYDADKSRVELIHPTFILALGEHYAVGAKKYADRNWEKGMSWSRCIASALRHLLKFAMGQEYEIEVIEGKEYKMSHIIAVAWNCAALHYYMEHHRDKDDRVN